jgi:hypothetical protein
MAIFWDKRHVVVSKSAVIYGNVLPQKQTFPEDGSDMFLEICYPLKD